VALPPQHFQIRHSVCPPPPLSAQQLALHGACPGKVLLLDRDLQQSAARGLHRPLVPVHREGGLQIIRVREIRPPSACGLSRVGSIASSTCTVRLVNQANGWSLLLPCRRHPHQPACLCCHHRPGPRRRGGSTLMACHPTGTTTVLRTIRPTPTSPLPPHAGPSCRRRRFSLLSPRRLLPAPTPGTLTPNSWLIVGRLARRIILVAIIVTKAFAAFFFPFLSLG
jgi:hypothetical protein